MSSFWGHECRLRSSFAFSALLPQIATKKPFRHHAESSITSSVKSRERINPRLATFLRFYVAFLRSEWLILWDGSVFFTIGILKSETMFNKVFMVNNFLCQTQISRDANFLRKTFLRLISRCREKCIIRASHRIVSDIRDKRFTIINRWRSDLYNASSSSYRFHLYCRVGYRFKWRRKYLNIFVIFLLSSVPCANQTLHARWAIQATQTSEQSFDGNMKVIDETCSDKHKVLIELLVKSTSQ